MHHVTMITADAPGTVAFYADVLGLRLVKQTVNFDAPEAYHLYFGDERGTPGSILTWFQFAGARRGRAGPGMIHRLELGVATAASLDFWTRRLEAHGVTDVRRDGDSLVFVDPDGLSLALVVAPDSEPPLRAEHPAIPGTHALTGVAGARAHPGEDLAADGELLTEALGFTELGPGEYRLDGARRRFRYAYDAAAHLGMPGAGTVHHIAWHSPDADHLAWRRRVGEAGMRVTPVIDRDYFLSIYFRQPQGILFEIATTSPGFAVDEDPAHLGEGLRLPRQHEHLRARLQATLAPLVNPRATR